MPVREVEGFGGLGGFGKFWQFGAFAGGQTAALKAHRKPLLWPWPWGACWGSGLGPGVPAGQGVWRAWTVLESARRVWRALEGLEGLEGFGGWSDRTSSTPAVVPGAAPALAKAGVGGYTWISYDIMSHEDISLLHISGPAWLVPFNLPGLHRRQSMAFLGI